MKSILSGIAMLLAIFMGAQVQVTFQVNMTGQTINQNGVHIAGAFQGWNPASTPLADQGNGLYAVTLELAEGTFQYKFINGNNWPQVESVPVACGVSDGFGGYNRSITIAGNDPVITSPICFGTCAPCTMPPNMVNVSISVDLSDQTVSPNGVHVAGNFQGWSASVTELTSMGNGIYTHTFEVAENTEVIYKFINGNDWPQVESVPQACGVGDGFGGYNRSISVGTGDVVVPVVCFGTCAACVVVEDPEMVQVTLSVRMTEQTVDLNGVHLIGSFQNWTLPGELMTSVGNDVYEVAFEIEEGSTIDYKFLNGIDYTVAEIIPAECGVDDGFGGSNRRVVLTTLADTIIPTICFGSCLDCVMSNTIELTFQVDMSEQTVGPNGVHVAGAFNNWSADGTPMSDEDDDNVFTATVPVDADAQVFYKFINGNVWAEQEVLPAECALSDGQGNLNRVVYTASSDMVLPQVCFEACEDCGVIIDEPSNMITFQVNMSNETVSPNGVYITGNFNNWSPDLNAMTDVNNDGVYTTTIEIDEWANISFKFINGNDFSGVESVPSSCGLPDGLGGYNRLLQTGPIDVSFGPVCFGTCDICLPILPPTMVNVTLQVNMQNETVSPNGVHVTGSFQGWDPATTIMTDTDADGIYEVVVDVEVNTEAQFKFINGNAWEGAESVPQTCGITNELNRYINVLANDTVYGPVCFGECVDCDNVVLPTTVDITFLVNMQNEIVDINGVHLAGNIQSWNPAASELTDVNTDGIYEITLEVPINSEAIFKFINGNSWSNEESVPSECGLSNGFGGYNRTFNTTEEDAVFGPVCFGECLDCAPVLDSVQIAFRVDMSNEIVSNGVSFQSPDVATPAPMYALGNGVYEYVGLFEIGTVVEYLFVNGSSNELVPEACSVDVGVNGMMREFTVGETTQVVGPVCFASCEACIIVEPEMVSLILAVDMSNEIVSPNGVHVAGTFNSWSTNISELTDDNLDGIYMVDVSVPANSLVSFKFINGNAWGSDESIEGACAFGPEGNRQIQMTNTSSSYGPLCFGECAECGVIVEPTLVTVVFQVNMNNEVVSANGVHIAGNFQGWNPNGTVMNSLGGGVYELSYSVESNQTLNFKFINGSTWGEQETVPSTCGVDNGFGGYNRSLVVADEDVVFGPICFNDCVDCEEVVEPTTVAVTFQVDMTNEVVSADGVHIAGNFQGWNPAGTEMTDGNGDGVYEYTSEVSVNSAVLFKFINGNGWTGSEVVPMDCGQGDGFGGYNRILNVLNNDTTYGPVCFGTCAACGTGTPVLITLRVNMANESVSADGVFVAGDFNDWDPTATQMSEYAPDLYEAVVVVLSGETVSYKFLNGMDWTGAEDVPSACGMDDGTGNINRSSVAGESNTTLPVVCFSGCVDCVVNPEIEITFQVNMMEQIVDPAGVFIAGSFNGFNSTANEMTQSGPSTYSLTITVPFNTPVTYKFLNGPTWESVPFECGQDDGFGGFNRFVQGGMTDVVMPLMCFNECEDCDIAVDEKVGAYIRLYPNPADELVTIYGLQPGEFIQIWSVQGQLVQRFKAMSEKQSIDLSAMAAGIYTVQVGNATQRLIKR